MLTLDPEKVCHIVVKARAFGAKEEIGDPARRELLEFMRGLDTDEQIELVALCWLGRATYSLDEWDEALSEAEAAHNERTAEYLLRLPLLADYLEKGLAAFGGNGKKVDSRNP
ncbi:MAG: DUF3775 domain-containing protein [Parvibaculum sp.]|uniref:DUF3775 domain-containing protein n=1 Tax=Parvibaculum sp. TaxID=2024848 RepID=UPI002AB9DFCB|nr:DUF3775 domain-containing protein [Parvibaculum sp.]MDZ4381492.1 DUF3775 domain-containing protein [Parvibaculum sp.]